MTEKQITVKKNTWERADCVPNKWLIEVKMLCFMHYDQSRSMYQGIFGELHGGIFRVTAWGYIRAQLSAIVKETGVSGILVCVASPAFSHPFFSHLTPFISFMRIACLISGIYGSHIVKNKN